jgi:hypothetical protein
LAVGSKTKAEENQMSNYDASRNDERYRFTDTAKREQSEALRLEIAKHTKEFLKRGGKIQVVPVGQIKYQETPFKIKPEQEKQDWKEGKPRKSHAKN